MTGRGGNGIALVALLLAVAPWSSAQGPNLGSEAQQQAGKVLYDKYCAQCHGTDGAGDGYAAPYMLPQPRDFTSGKFKLRTTPSGALPTDDDLRKVIRNGMPYTTMIGWPNFSNQEVDNLIYYIKTFSADFKDLNYYDPPIKIPDPPAFSAESAKAGREIYQEMECANCHGDQGRGDGPSAPTLVNDARQPILPADLTKRWTFRGGPSRSDIYRTFSTGLNGTPMPSYADSLSDEQRWRLVDYVYSLGTADTPNYSEQVIAKGVDDDLDLSRGEAIFEAAPSAFLPLIGQIIEPGRAFHPAVNRIEVKAVHNRDEIAFLLRWHDMRADTTGENGPAMEAPEGLAIGEPEEEAPAEVDPLDPFGDAVETESDEGADDFWGDATEDSSAADDFFSMDEPTAPAKADTRFSDAVALQIPLALPEGIRLPYFIFGDSKNPVDVWFANLAQQQPQRFVGRGSESLTEADPDGLEMSASYDAGVWTVLMKRKRRVEDAMAFEEAQWYPMTLSVWDGWSEDRGNKRALTRWYYVYVEPTETVRPLVPMTKAALATLGIEILLIAFVRRKHRTSSSTPQTNN